MLELTKFIKNKKKAFIKDPVMYGKIHDFYLICLEEIFDHGANSKKSIKNCKKSIKNLIKNNLKKQNYENTI